MRQGVLKGDKEATKAEEYTLKCDAEEVKGDTGAVNNLKWRWEGIQRQWRSV